MQYDIETWQIQILSLIKQVGNGLVNIRIQVSLISFHVIFRTLLIIIPSPCHFIMKNFKHNTYTIHPDSAIMLLYLLYYISIHSPSPIFIHLSILYFDTFQNKLQTFVYITSKQFSMHITNLSIYGSFPPLGTNINSAIREFW